MLFSNLIWDLVDVERHCKFKVEIIYIFKRSHSVMSDLFWYIFFSNLLLNAGLPIVHCNSFFLLGCVVVQNVAARGSVKCAWPENNWRIYSYSKWWVLMLIYLFFHMRFMYLMCVANGRQETWFHLLLLTHVWIMLMLANFVNFYVKPLLSSWWNSAKLSKVCHSYTICTCTSTTFIIKANPISVPSTRITMNGRLC